MRYYKLATPEDIEAGKRWYHDAYAFCKRLSEQYNIEMYKVVGITAALSPQQTWETNKVWAEEFIRNRGRGFMCNRERTIKCKKIYNCSHPEEAYDYLSTKPSGSPKTKAFFRNIILPDFCDTVCIDRHALAAGTQRPHKTRPIDDKEGRITPAQYRFLSKCYIDAANKVKMIPSAFQATIWNLYRKQRGLEKTVLPEIEGYVPMDIEAF